MRCGSELITKGTSEAKVAALCGQPAQVVRPAVADGVCRLWVLSGLRRAGGQNQPW
jgi:hypothetical protein